MARFIKEGYWQKHVQKMRRYYIKKYKCISQAIDTYLIDKASIVSLNSGLSVLLEINTPASEMELVARAKEAGIKIVPVSEYFSKHIQFQQKSLPHILLAFRGVPIENIEPAIKLLSEAWFSEQELTAFLK